MKRIKLLRGHDMYDLQKEVDEWQDKNPTFVVIDAKFLYTGSNFYMTIIYDNGQTPKFETIK